MVGSGEGAGRMHMTTGNGRALSEYRWAGQDRQNKTKQVQGAIN